MYCENCGKELPAGARFCDKCGTKVFEFSDVKTTTPDVSRRESSSRTQKPRKSKKRETEIKAEKPNFFIRIILLIVSGYLLWNSLGNLAVNFIGESAKPYNMSSSRTGKKTGRGKSDYKWSVYYEFNADDGESYFGYGNWHGTESNAALGLGEYHVGYLSFAPRVNRLVKHDSVKKLIQEVKKANREGWLATDTQIEIIIVIVTTIIISTVEGLLGYLFLGMAIPEIPPIKFKKKEKQKKKQKKKR